MFHNGTSYQELIGRISHLALDFIRRESGRFIEDVGLDPSKCDHVIRIVYGLPCAHELLEYRCENWPIPLEVVDQHWGKLTVLLNSETYKDVDNMGEMISFKKFFEDSTNDQKKALLRK